MLTKFTPRSVSYILLVYVIGIVFFTLFRITLIAVNAQQLQHIPGLFSVLSHTMLMGLRFDIVISGYILILPALLLLIAELTGKLKPWVFKSSHLFIILLYIICFLICTADIPFFSNYNNRLNTTILNWTSTPLLGIKMVLQDSVLLRYLLFFFLVSVAFTLIMKRVFRNFRNTLVNTGAQSTHSLPKIATAIIFLMLMALGIRGRTEAKSPILIGTAFFSNYNFPNQAGLNPVFTFMIGCTENWKEENKKLHLIADSTAARNVKYYLHTDNDGLSRTIVPATREHKYNVVIVLMESMSGFYLERFGNRNNLTPNLDTLAKNGYNFINVYSAGIHTFNGIFSTLYSHPALMARHTMYDEVIPAYTGLPYFLEKRGYETMYFTTHDGQFDNVAGFLTANHMHRVISQKDYPSAQVLSSMGVADHYMFDFSLPLLTKQQQDRRPFLAVYMTASNHPPYTIPDGIPFKPKHSEIRHGAVEYTDWSVGYFMKKAATLPWYDSTIFVFLGDHGTWEGESYGALPYWYSHIPLIIYSPMFRQAPKELHIAGGQTDVFPTIAGLLGGTYINNTMGADLLNEGRPWAIFSQDDKIGVADSTDIYVWEKNGSECMYRIWTDIKLLDTKRAKADSMRTYAFSMIQYAQWLRDNNKAGPDVKY